MHYDMIHTMTNLTSRWCTAYESILQVLQIIKEWCTVKDGWKIKLVERSLSCVVMGRYQVIGDENDYHGGLGGGTCEEESWDGFLA